MVSSLLLVIINMAAMNIVDHVSLLHVAASPGYVPQSGIAGSSGSAMSNFQSYQGNANQNNPEFPPHTI